MKKFLLIAAVAFFFGAPAFAQISVLDIEPEIESKCTEITRTMAQELRLNEPEYIKLKELNRERMVKTYVLLQNHNQNAPILQEKMREVELAYDQKIASILNPKQLHAYASYKQAVSQVNFVAVTRD